MEFLDPEEKRERTIRLFIGYAFGIALIVLGTLAISFILQGFNVLSPSNDARNGLLFLDSKPLSANIYINDTPNKRTDARFVLPEGKYNVRLTESGYRDWQKAVDVIGGSVTYHVYPRLFPVDIKKQTTATYAATPKLWTQSPNRRWVIILPNQATPIFNLVDTTKITDVPQQFNLPEPLVSSQDMTSTTFKVVEWSTDNRHLLLQKILADGTMQYLVVDREKPDQSFNLTERLSLQQGTTVKLRDKKYDQYYLLDTSTKLLRRANLANGIEPVIVADGVVSYASYESNIILYATESGAKNGTYSVRILDGATNYLLQPVVASPVVLLDVARYEGDWFFVAGSASQENTAVYINPIQNSNNIDEFGALRPQLQLNRAAPKYIGFSDNARFIGVQNATAFTVYDAELKTIYTFDSPVALPPEGASWMDGHRYHVTSNNNEHIFEFDGTNFQTLTENINGLRAYYDRDYVRLLTLAPQQNGTLNLQVGNLTLD